MMHEAPMRPDTVADLQVRRTYRGYLDGDVLAHVTAWDDDDAVARLLDHVPGLTRVVVISGVEQVEVEIWTA